MGSAAAAFGSWADAIHRSDGGCSGVHGGLGQFAAALEPGSGHQQAELRQQQLERIELDRLQLQAHWRQRLTTESGCAISPEQLIAVASALPVPPQLQRDLIPADQDDALQVRWRAERDPALQRERLFTPAGLGLCPAEPPLTGSQVEAVLP